MDLQIVSSTFCDCYEVSHISVCLPKHEVERSGSVGRFFKSFESSVNMHFRTFEKLGYEVCQSLVYFSHTI